MDPRELQQLLRSSGISPAKSLGQHFLCDDAVIERILASSRLQTSDDVVEVGPGLGILTFALAPKVKRVFALEFDRAIVAFLRSEIPKRALSNIQLLQADMLHFPLNAFCETNGIVPHSYKMVSNLPYNIASRVLRLFLESPWAPSSMTVLIQKEVAERACAPSGKRSMLSVAVQAYAVPRLEAIVLPSSFWPAPAVKSAILHLDINPTWMFHAPERDFFRVATIGFSSRRKQLVNTLASGFRATKEEIVRAMSVANIEPSRRAETLSCEEWDSLAISLRTHFPSAFSRS